jgi:hypothetical protein
MGSEMIVDGATNNLQASIPLPIAGSTKALDAFVGDFDTTLGPILASIKKHVDAFKATKPDAKTEDGREAIRSFAHKLARTKTALEAQGKAVADIVKRQPKIVDANRAKAWEIIEGWQKSVRSPLDEYEAAEAARKQRHIDAIEWIKTRTVQIGALTVAELEELTRRTCEHVPAVEAFREEFAEEYRIALEDALARLRTALEARKRYDADQAELARLRAAEQARLAFEAEEREKERAAEVEQARIAAAAAEAEAAKAREALAAEQAERRRLEAIESERRQKEADEAARIERERLQAAAAEAAERKRQENRNHQAAVNRNAADAMLDTIYVATPGLKPTEKDFRLFATTIAKAIVTAIAKGEIPAVTINY